jgi:hypothetical protein
MLYLTYNLFEGDSFMMKKRVFKILRLFIFISIIIGSSVGVLEAYDTASLVFFTVFLISGIVGVFFEIYKK